MKKPLTLLALGLVAIAAMGADDSCAVEDDTPIEVKDKKTGKPKPAEPDLTAGQENAIRAAQDYLNFAAFSKAGLEEQLSSSAGDGYPEKDAKYAVNHIVVNWNQQAYKAAKEYLDFSSFSLDGLIQQLQSSAGDQYTPAQAKYGATKAYNE